MPPQRRPDYQPPQTLPCCVAPRESRVAGHHVTATFPPVSDNTGGLGASLQPPTYRTSYLENCDRTLIGPSKVWWALSIAGPSGEKSVCYKPSGSNPFSCKTGHSKKINRQYNSSCFLKKVFLYSLRGIYENGAMWFPISPTDGSVGCLCWIFYFQMDIFLRNFLRTQFGFQTQVLNFFESELWQIPLQHLQ